MAKRQKDWKMMYYVTKNSTGLECISDSGYRCYGRDILVKLKGDSTYRLTYGKITPGKSVYLGGEPMKPQQTLPAAFLA